MDGYIRNADDEVAAFQPLWTTHRDRLIFCRRNLEDIIDDTADYSQVLKGKAAIAKIDEKLSIEPMEKERQESYSLFMTLMTTLLVILASANAVDAIWLFVESTHEWTPRCQWQMALICLYLLATYGCIFLARTAAGVFPRQESTLALTAVSLLFRNLLNWTTAAAKAAK